LNHRNSEDPFSIRRFSATTHTAQSQKRLSMTKPSDTTLSYLAIGSASFYLPLTFWASNAWDIGNPTFILLYGTGVSLVGMAAFWLLSKTRARDLSAALSISLSLMVLMSWQRLPLRQTVLSLLLLAATVFIVVRVGPSIQRGIAAAIVLLFGVAAVAQVTISHALEAAEIPLLALTAREPADATEVIEDVLVVVVDSYPSLAWANQRFGHDTSFIELSLEDAGFTTPAVGWSQHSNTSFSVSALMEMKPIVDAASDDPWSNSRNLGSIIGGENLVASTLRSAGFQQIQIESGWHLGQCSRTDVCIEASWLNETTWSLLEPSVIGGWLEAEYGSWIVPASKSVEARLHELRPVFGNGEHDYVFAHVMLPHGPYVVDSTCNTVPPHTNGNTVPDSAIRSQLSCTDLVLSRIIEVTNETTAVLITSDHGVKSTGQLQKSPDSWTKEDIADAFTILLSYRLPESCDPPGYNTNTIVMSAIVECATTFDAPFNDGDLLIGLRHHSWIGPLSQREIELGLASGRSMGEVNG